MNEGRYAQRFSIESFAVCYLTTGLLYTDDLVVVADTEDDLIKRLNEWKDNVENRGVRVNMNKNKVMISGERHKVTQKAVRGHVLSVVEVLVIIQTVY